ncbi:hypothetical protein ACM66B_000262 [Microbotryomycetes sp. NB124-2]
MAAHPAERGPDEQQTALSPRLHVLRPRKSFQRNPFTSKMSALNGASTTTANPFKSTNKPASCTSDSSQTPADSTRARAKRTLEPTHVSPSPERQSSNGHDASTPSSSSLAAASAPPPPREPTAGLKKFANSLQGAFTSKNKQTKQSKRGFDLSDWNHDLAAIESPSIERTLDDATAASARPTSSVSRSPSPISTRSTSNTPKVLARSRPTRSCAVLRDLSRSPEVSIAPGSRGPASLTRATAGHSPRQSLELPAADTRRRKSDEMDDEERDVYSSQIASPVRREGFNVHSRVGSLAHAHTLRSSRMLSHHAHFDANPVTTSPRPLATHLTFGSPATTQSTNPFSTEAYSNASHPLGPAFNAPPPLKRIPVEGDSDATMDDNVFGGCVVSSSGKKPSRTKSLSRNGPPSAINAAGLPMSNSHPGWTGDGFETAPPPGSSRVNSGLASPHDLVFGVPSAPMKTRSRTASSVTALDTLDESGPAPDYFSAEPTGSRRPSLELYGSPAPATRRRSEHFSLFGSDVGAQASPARPGSSSMPDMSAADELDVSASTSPAPVRRLRSLSNAKRHANLASLAMTARKEDEPSSTATGGEEQSRMVAAAPPATPVPPRLVTSRRVASFDSLLQAASGTNPSPFGRPGTVTTPHGSAQTVHPSVHMLRDAHNNGRKRNANGALLVGPGGMASSRLGATSPIVAPSSPATWNARDVANGMDEDEDDDAMAMEDDSGMWDACMSPPPPPPPLTDGTTSASSSLSTSLSSHADNDSAHAPASFIGSSTSSRSISASNEPATFLTPQNYKNVKPLQAAFMSTGLVSKRSRPRSSSTSGAPVFNLHQHLLQSQLDERVAAENLAAAAAAGGIATSTVVDEHQPALLPRSTSIMPDTPVKRSAFTTSTSNGNLGQQQQHQPLTAAALEVNNAASSDDSADGSPVHRQQQQQSSEMSSLSPVHTHLDPASRDSSASKSSSSNATVSGNNHQRVSPSHSPLGADVGPRGDISPSIHASRTIALSNGKVTNSLKALRIKPTLFRRRSSGQLSAEATHLGLRSGSSSSSGGTIMREVEPMTPTRTTGQKWGDGRAQLLDTPVEETPITPVTPAFPPLASQFAFLPPGVPTVGRSSYPFSDMERRQFAINSTLAPGTTTVGRPQFRIRHSSSTAESLRHHEMQQPNWFESNFTILRTLGNGEFSDAFEVADRSRDGQVFAVKRTKNPFAGPKDRLRRLEEVDILRWFSMPEHSSPHLIALVDAWEQINHLFIQTELCANGNLCYFLEEYGREHEFLDEARVWKILNEMVAGIAHLHVNNVIHLDLKPANVFIDVHGHLKIGDFGLATRWPRLDPMDIVRGAAVTGAGFPWNGMGQLEGVWPAQRGEVRTRAKSSGANVEDLEREGDREYIAPEILAGRYGKEADIFSLGLVVLEAAANVVLPDNGPAWQKLRSNDFSDVNLKRLSPALVELLRAMLEKQPERRASIEQIQQYPVVAVLQTMLTETMRIVYRAVEQEVSSTGAVPPLLGATIAEADSFMDDVFHAAAARAAQPAVVDTHDGDRSAAVTSSHGDEMDVD